MGVAEAETAGLGRTLKDLAAGAAGGIAQVLIGELNIISIWIRCSSIFLSCIYMPSCTTW